MIFYRVTHHHDNEQERTERFFRAEREAVREAKRVQAECFGGSWYIAPRVDRVTVAGGKGGMLDALNGCFPDATQVW